MSLTEGDRETCTQENGGSGLENVINKGIYFPETVPNSDIDASSSGTLQCFLDGNLTNAASTAGPDQPVCNASRFNALLTQDNQATNACLSDFGDGYANIPVLEDAPLGQTFSDYYNAFWCRGTGEWVESPGYRLPANPESFQWPALDLATLTCSDGSSAADAKNPAGVPKLCGADFDAWFETQVPPGPTTTTARADTTLYGRERNRNDGAAPTLTLGGKTPFRGFKRSVVAFDDMEVQSFLDGGPLASAKLVLATADNSMRKKGRGYLWTKGHWRKKGHWVAIHPLHDEFAEGDGNSTVFYRGAGSGATWNCAEDVEIADPQKECARSWSIPPMRGFHHSKYRNVLFQEEGYTGRMSWDVTEDLRWGVRSWTIRRISGSGNLSYYSKEGSEDMGDPSLAPHLILSH